MSGAGGAGGWLAGGAATYRSLQRARDKVFSLAVRRSFSSFGPHSVIQLPFRVSGERNISIGGGVFVGAGSWLQAFAAIPRGDPLIEIGDGTAMAGLCVVSAVEHVSIGREVLIARNVYISDHNHAYSDTTQPVVLQGIDKVAPVTIGDGAWLGQNSVVTPGVRIGAGAVVGANSVVTADVPDHCLVAGAPARLIRVIEGNRTDPLAGPA